MMKLFYLLCSLGFSVDSDSNDEIFLKATESVAKHQILFRTDSDGVFSNSEDFSAFFKTVLHDTGTFHSENPPSPEDFSILYQRIKSFNHIWEFLIQDVVTHAQQFLSKAQGKPMFMLAAQQQIEAVYYYCSQWFHKIAVLYRQEIFLLKLISSGSNAQRLIRDIDHSDIYFSDINVATILRDLSGLMPHKQRFSNPVSDVLTGAEKVQLFSEIVKPANASFVFFLDEETAFSSLEDYATRFRELLTSVHQIDDNQIKENIKFLDKILTYILTQSEVNIMAYHIKALAGDEQLYLAARGCLDQATAFLKRWLPVFVLLYHSQLLKLENAIDVLAFSDEGRKFSNEIVQEFLARIQL
ncbi:MAG: hypothetical protein KF820_04745 [Candidatus Paracaedibacteraceae bacterium]|nr:hypothetical protein [Candidatus Paracaedibacteraceae bacterium]